MLPRDEPRPHGHPVERTADLVREEVRAIHLDAALHQVRPHAGTLPAVQPKPPVTRTKLGTSTDTLRIGDPAPDLALKSHDGREIRLAALRGKPVVIAFFHFAFTGT